MLLQDCRFSQLIDMLPQRLSQEQLNEVLGEVATFRAPSIEQTGTYLLKRECWSEFDPFFVLFSKQQLQRSLQRAADLGDYR